MLVNYCWKMYTRMLQLELVEDALVDEKVSGVGREMKKVTTNSRGNEEGDHKKLREIGELSLSMSGRTKQSPQRGRAVQPPQKRASRAAAEKIGALWSRRSGTVVGLGELRCCRCVGSPVLLPDFRL